MNGPHAILAYRFIINIGVFGVFEKVVLIIYQSVTSFLKPNSLWIPLSISSDHPNLVFSSWNTDQSECMKVQLECGQFTSYPFSDTVSHFVKMILSHELTIRMSLSW